MSVKYFIYMLIEINYLLFVIREVKKDLLEKYFFLIFDCLNMFKIFIYF